MKHINAFWLTIAAGLIFALGAQILGDTQVSARTATVTSSSSAAAIMALDKMQKLPGALSALPTPPIPPDNPQTVEKIELGKMLFFDTRLSRDYTLSCASCHNPEKGYSDGRPKAVGIGQKVLGRRSPSILNAAYNSAQFWDGRAASLEEQARGPIMANAEMGMTDEKTLVERLQTVPEYRKRFDQVFGGETNLASVAKAIAAFERTLATPDSPFDHYARGDKRALADQQKRGLILFFGKASCTQCHNGANFTDNKFYSLGALPAGVPDSDAGRFAITKDVADRGAFKTPGLRNVAARSPYMHNGSMAKLEEVIDWYDRGGGDGPKSALLHKLDLTAAEKADLLSFLKSLTGQMPVVTQPSLPPVN